MGEAGHPGPGFDDPELGAEVESDSAWGGDEHTIDQLWLEDLCAEDSAVPFVKCQRFEGPRAGYVFKLDEHGLGYYVDDGRRASCASIGLGLESCE